MKWRNKPAVIFMAFVFVVMGMTGCISVEESQSDIGENKAKSIAFSHAEVKEREISGLRVERDSDDRGLEYHVEFYVGNKEYNYEINGEDGTILDYDVDIEDRN